MASFNEHLTQAKSNLSFFKEISDRSNFFDWQVTVCYYSAVHLVNAHLAKKANLHYRTHEDTKNAINPNNALSIAKFNQDTYNRYLSLEKLARRARYLCSDSGDSSGRHLTFERHVAKSVYHLNTIMTYFKSTHGVDFETIELTCPLLKSEIQPLDYFQHAR